MLRILNTLKKYSVKGNYREEGFDWLTNNPDDEYISNLALAKNIIEDYINYGIYFRESTKYELNNNGATDWDETINRTSSFVVNGTPLYFDNYSINYFDETDNLISKIHEWVLKWSIDKYSDLLGYNVLEYNKNIELNISKEYLLSLIEREIDESFSDREIYLLKNIYNIFKRTYRADTNIFSLYGTGYFNLVWEEILSKTFKNERELYLPLIPKPVWYDNNNKFDKNTLKPDILINKSDKFYIIDAKYYNIKFEDDYLAGNPGVEDVNKQFLYEKALKPYVDCSDIVNVFAFPLELNGDKLIEIFGRVEVDYFDLSPIILVYINTQMILDFYLQKSSIYDKLFDELNK